MERHRNERIVKIPLSIELIRRVDEALVAGFGGYTTRTEFFRDAAEGLLLELQYEPAPAEPVVVRESFRASSSQLPAVENFPALAVTEAGRARAQSGHAAGTAGRSEHPTTLRLPSPSGAAVKGEADVDTEPLFGMHNRDFPSLWVAFRLAERTVAGPVPYESFVQDATTAAWDYADDLRSLEPPAGQKLTALFPTNRAKPQSASDAFKTFAVGTVMETDGGTIRADGPLFSWRVCQVARSGNDLLLGLTPEGWELLRSLNGISLELPHSPDRARSFFKHLRRYSPGEWWGFRTLMIAAGDQPTRLELVETFQRERPDWSENVAATNAQGYVARAREWGVVQQKQVGGRYALTEFGDEYLLKSINDNHKNNQREDGKL